MIVHKIYISLLSCALVLAFQANADGINKCVVDGKVVYQDAPCKIVGETIAQAFEIKERNEVRHKLLDRLQAQGYGMVQRPSPRPVKRPPKKEGEYFIPQPRSYAAEMARQEEISAKIQEETLRKNAESAAKLTQRFNDINQACSGKLVDYPVLGMTEAVFIKCTIHANANWISQIVVSKDGDIPLKLYVFATPKASRVYSVGGVITAIKP